MTGRVLFTFHRWSVRNRWFPYFLMIFNSTKTIFVKIEGEFSFHNQIILIYYYYFYCPILLLFIFILILIIKMCRSTNNWWQLTNAGLRLFSREGGWYPTSVTFILKQSSSSLFLKKLEYLFIYLFYWLHEVWLLQA